MVEFIFLLNLARLVAEHLVADYLAVCSIRFVDSIAYSLRRRAVRVEPCIPNLLGSAAIGTEGRVANSLRGATVRAEGRIATALIGYAIIAENGAAYRLTIARMSAGWKCRKRTDCDQHNFQRYVFHFNLQFKFAASSGGYNHHVAFL